MTQFNNTNYQINSALILAGGGGKRLGSYSKSIQKCMLRYKGYPLLEHLIIKLKGVGVVRFTLLVGHLSSQIFDYFKNGREWGVEIIYVNEHFTSTSMALSKIIDSMNDSFFYCHGNIYFENDLLNLLLKNFNKFNNNIISIIHSSKLNHIKVNGMNGNRIKSFIVGNNNAFNLVFLGLGIYRKETVLNYLEPDKNKMTEEFLHNAVNDNQEIYGIIYKRKWFHIQDLSDIKDNELSTF
jgi:D-glycero-alpha-D-manno-heptose 1-phosphate guanylyltransferase